MFLKKQIIRNLFGVSLGSLINFLASMIFLSLSIDGFRMHEKILAYTLILFSFAQVLEAFRFPVTYEVKEGLSENEGNLINIICTNGIALSLLSSSTISCIVFILGLVEIIRIDTILFFAIFFYSANGVFWGIADAKDAVALTTVAKAISNTIGFFFIYMFSIYSPEKAYYAIIFPPLFFQLFLFFIIKLKFKTSVSLDFKYVNPTHLKLLAVKTVAVFINFLSSTAQGNIERICAIYLGGNLLILMTFFSELSNRLSFLPRMIYGAAYSLLIGNNLLNSIKIRFIGFLIITIIILFISSISYLFSSFLIETLLPHLSNEIYVAEILVYFIFTAMLKLYSYSGALVLNTKGDFKTQPLFTFLFVMLALSFYLFNKNDGDPIMIIIVTSIIAKSSDMIFGLYAAFKKFS